MASVHPPPGPGGLFALRDEGAEGVGRLRRGRERLEPRVNGAWQRWERREGYDSAGCERPA